MGIGAGAMYALSAEELDDIAYTVEGCFGYAIWRIAFTSET